MVMARGKKFRSSNEKICSHCSHNYLMITFWKNLLLIISFYGCFQVVQPKSDIDDVFLFDFGPRAGDTFLSKGYSQCSTAYNLPENFTFGGKIQSKLFVCVFGVIAFDEPLGSQLYDPANFETLNHSMIAPLYSDVFLRDNFLDLACVNSTYEGVAVHHLEDICDFYRNSVDNVRGKFGFEFDDVLDPALRDDLSNYSQRTVLF